MTEAACPRAIMSDRVTWMSGILLLAAGGCVMQSTYDTAVQEGITTKTELARALEEQKILTNHVRQMELSNADAVRDAEAAAAALRQEQDETEQQRHRVEQRIAKLKQQVAQATKQQHSLQYELTVAKENTAALQELIDVYQRKVRDGAMTTAAAPAGEPAVHKPFDPSTIPLAQDLPPPPVVGQPTPAPPSAPVQPATPTTNPKRPPPPPEEGWVASITGWLLSIWRSVFS
jgi:flagellar motility protein MotE (MotC chaperone)